MRSWKLYLPEYTIRRWDESNIRLENDYMRDSYHSGQYSKLSNYVRLDVLHRYGGIYLDTDVEVRQSFDDLLALKCFVGFQIEENIEDWVNNAVIGSVPAHPFLRRCMDKTVSLYRQDGVFYRSPQVVSGVLREMGLNRYGSQTLEDVSVLSKEYFYPYSWLETQPADEEIKPETYAIHHWNASWKKREARLSERLTRVAGKIRRRLRALAAGAEDVV